MRIVREDPISHAGSKNRHPNEGDKQPFVQPGAWVVSDGSFFTGTEGRLVINIEDGQNMRRHSNQARLNGCCGLDGCNGPNRMCARGAEVATEKSDYWMPHALVFDPAAIRIVENRAPDKS
jgi:hypothetical protein